MRIRPETDADRAAVADVNERAFGRLVEARLIEAVPASDRFVPDLSLVAEQDGIVVGHVLVSYVDIEPGLRRVFQVAPLAVAPSHQRGGIGTALMEEALRRLDSRGEPLVLVEGDPAYYRRFGFRRADVLGIDPPSGVPAQYFMARRLGAYDPSLRGRAVYPEAFAEAS